MAGYSNAQSVAPVPGIEVGKVRVVSINSLKPEVKKVVDPVGGTSTLAKRATYEQIPDEAIRYIKNFQPRVIHPRELARNITFTLSDLSASDLAKYPFEGAYPEGPTPTGPWTSIARTFRRDDNVLIVLREWDYIKDGGGIMMVKELMNARVGNSLARFSVKKSPTGSVVSDLTWATPRKFYVLTVLDKVSNDERQRYNLKWMTNLAGSVKEAAR